MQNLRTGRNISRTQERKSMARGIGTVQSIEFKAMQKTIESMLRRRPEYIIEILESFPEEKERVFARLRKFDGVKFYKYLNMECKLILYIKENLEDE